MATRRQLLLLCGGAILWVGGIRTLPEFLSRWNGFEFIPLERVPGFRTISSASGSTSSGSGGFDFMTGLNRGDRLPPGLMAQVKASPAEALFDAPIKGDATQVAYVFDYYCPYCRILSGHLDDLAAASRIVVTRHHWPIFGDASVLAARATLAAAMQGKADIPYRRFLRTSVRVTPRYLKQVADDLDLSWPDLTRDMQSAPVTASLDRTRALVRLFAFVGTPALVVGRTVVQGEISKARLRDLLEYEQAGPTS
ncbi:DsbA family protein [uncultured Jannaschia sp.]|uniref:DsbA family protein n=1 Tax=uncultured Jannaschia sp. TaxID=293347 RepID=UPI002602BFA8|nr:DsbA family protein [uncultured Jannaschia sp.]